MFKLFTNAVFIFKNLYFNYKLYEKIDRKLIHNFIETTILYIIQIINLLNFKLYSKNLEINNTIITNEHLRIERQLKTYIIFLTY